MKTLSYPMPLAAVLSASLLFSCTPDIELLPLLPEESSSSSPIELSSSSEEVSSSSAEVHSSSSSVPSSVPSSSSIVPSSSSAGVPSGGKGNDIANYRTVPIGNQVWMAENLNYAVVGSKCGNDNGTLSDVNTSFCDTYGRLYNWTTAMALPSSCNSSACSHQVSQKHQGICPSEWHIPSNADWNVLMKFVNPDCSNNSNCNVEAKLKATSGWNSNGNGTDIYGFAALPGGYGLSGGSFYSVGSNGSWWSASENNSNNAYYKSMSYNGEDMYYGNYGKSYLFSVRCVQD